MTTGPDSVAAYRPFDSVLVANRGEIAVRVLRAAREHGLRAIAVASEADRTAPHVLCADTAAVIGPGPAKDSYLDVDRLLAAARDTGAEAVHPGYGFLSESAEFARRVQDAGLVWIGPPPDVIDALGDKVRAKETARRVGVPVLDGYEGDPDDVDAVREAAARIGYPLLVKAAAGGGGRGMRVVQDEDGLADALGSAQREAASAFSSGRVFLERFVDPARHIEVQVVGDTRGGVLHLGERECSVQRRYQKVVEESPSPAVDEGLRTRLGEASERLVGAIGYVGAGTVEFLVGPPDERGECEFWFLEVNTRLQVEHPVTEEVTGVDLVGLQFFAAAGEPLPLAASPEPRGCAIEVRVCAEDPSRGFTPQVGELVHVELPRGPGIRVDAGVRSGSVVSEHYDSLLLKLIASGPDRDTARARLLRALDSLVLLGPRTNVGFLRRIVAHPEFAAGRLSTDFLTRHGIGGESAEPLPDEAVVAAIVGERLTVRAEAGGGGGHGGAAGVWDVLGPWRAVGEGRSS